MTNFIYLLNIYPYNEKVYKIGRTDNFVRRLQNYKSHKPNIILCVNVDNCVEMEKKLINIFKKKYIHDISRGNEYFIGNKNDMKKVIFNAIIEEELNNINQVNKIEINKLKDELLNYKNEKNKNEKIYIETIDKIEEKILSKNINLDINDIKNLIEKIPSMYADNYDDWFKISAALKNLGFKKNNQEDYYNLFELFSQKSCLKYNHEKNKIIWNNLKYKENNTYSIGIIIFYFNNKKTHLRQDYEKIFKSYENITLLPPINVSTNINDEYNIFKENFEKNVCFIDISVNYYDLNFNKFYKKNEIIAKYSCLHEKFESLFDIWNKDKNRLKYSKIDFLPPPQKCPKDVLNIWSGYYYDNYKLKNKEIDKLKIIKKFKYLLNHLTKSKEKNYKYLKQWTADLIQNPGRKSGIVYIFYSEQCILTGLYNIIIRNLLKSNNKNDIYEYTYSTSKIDDVYGIFNIAAKNKIYINFNEVIETNTKKISKLMKNFIIDETINIHQKSHNEFNIFSPTRSTIFTNDILSITSEKSNKIYFTEKPNILSEHDKKYLFEDKDYIFDEDEYKILYDYLKYGVNILYTNMDEWQTNMPIDNNSDYQNIKDAFIDTKLIWLYDYMLKLKDDMKLSENSNTVLIDSVWLHFQSYLTQNKIRYDISSHIFKSSLLNGTLINKTNITYQRLQKDNNRKFYITFNVEKIINELKPRMPDYLKDQY